MLRVPTLGQLVKEKSDLDDFEVKHLHSLFGSWQLIADLSFSDLLAWCRMNGGGFVCVGQMRPHTAQTVHPEDAYGREILPGHIPELDRVFKEGKRIEPGQPSLSGPGVSMEAIPVSVRGRTVAVMTKQSASLKDRRPGRLEQNYLECGEALMRMVEEETFPFAEAADPALAPRVGDGMIRLSGAGRVLYASPNAISAFRRLGILSNLDGELIADVGVDVTPAVRALALGAPVEGDTQSGDTVVLQKAIPLLRQPGRQITGAVLLLRDVTELRYRERQLESKETVISEIHHRVKNNLQTIASLLRLQARRLSSDAKQELEEAVRRISSIALVHDTLSNQPTQSVAFGQVAARLVEMVGDALVHPDSNITIEIAGDPGELSAELATPVALVLVELLQNAVQHAFTSSGGRVSVRMDRAGTHLHMSVQDDGAGLPEGFELQNAGLGFQIVRTLVETELKGRLELASNRGTKVSVKIPVGPSGSARP